MADTYIKFRSKDKYAELPTTQNYSPLPLRSTLLDDSNCLIIANSVTKYLISRTKVGSLGGGVPVSCN